ncbi:MAG TPA: hypothetical protein ENG09_00550 [Candidatus Syntrophoarchaeum butanivorans]|uniref:Type II secretion system protein GspF domain-containing protein n=1 Tax=Candidatus Syntropharchaeum butanivorans TaxID=1839936 RepID=A0A7C1B6J1_9EURY|nr:hypothetical protein [Candidatus Syntrophoarchaeum butanivorans]
MVRSRRSRRGGMESFYRLCSISYRIFGRGVNRNDLSGLSLSLKRARINIPADLYLSLSRLAGALFALFGAILGVLLIYALIPASGDIFLILLTVLSGSVTATLFYLLTVRAFMAYPVFRANTRRILIDKGLLHAINYLYAMSKGGMSLIDAFNSLKKHEAVYGESAKEIGYIARDVEYFGLDLRSALMRGSKNTPSEKMRDFLEGLISVMNTGGSLEDYFSLKSRQYQDLAEGENSTFLEVLSVLAETYVTLFVAAPLFLITIIIVLGMLKSGTLLILSAVVYIIIPLGTSLFILLLDTITTRTDEEAPSFVRIKRLNVFDNVRLVERESEGIIPALKRYEQIERIKFFLHSPFRFFIEKPSRCFYVTLPLASAYLLSILQPAWEIPDGFDRNLFYTALILLIPYSILFEIRAKRIREIDGVVPEFLRRLKTLNETGLNLVECIRVIIRSNLGVLTSELLRVARSIEWGSTLEDAFHKLEVRVKTGALSRTITLLVDADRATGNLRDVLAVAASNAEIAQRLMERRRAAMSIYLLIVYITFAVFLFTIYILTTKFLGTMPEIPIKGAERFLSSDYNLKAYERVLFHGSLLQGFFSGIVGGQMSSGNPYSGIKHAVVMMIAAFLVFELVIWG